MQRWIATAPQRLPIVSDIEDFTLTCDANRYMDLSLACTGQGVNRFMEHCFLLDRYQVRLTGSCYLMR